MKNGLLLVALAGAIFVFAACQSDTGSPAGPVTPAGTAYETPMITGYVYESEFAAKTVPEAHVWFTYEDAPAYAIGQAWTNKDGYYVISGNPRIWSNYEGEDLMGYAEHEEYGVTGPVMIYNFDLDNIPYVRDFYFN